MSTWFRQKALTFLLVVEAATVFACKPVSSESSSGEKRVQADPNDGRKSDEGESIPGYLTDLRIVGQLVLLPKTLAAPPRILCESLGRTNATCQTRAQPTGPGTARFELECPGVGSSSVACYIQRDEHLDVMLVDGASFITVGSGTLVLEVKAAGLGPATAEADKEKSTSLINRDVDLAAAGVQPTVLPLSLAGDWRGGCVGDQFFPCSKLVPPLMRFELTRSDIGQPILDTWVSPKRATACNSSSDARTRPRIVVGDTTIPFDLHNVSGFEHTLDAVIQAMPAPVVKKAEEAISTRIRIGCLEYQDSTCTERATGIYAGRSGSERDGVRYNAYTFLTALSIIEATGGLSSLCAEPVPVDMRDCLGASPMSHLFCSNVQNIINGMYVEIDAATGALVPPRLHNRTFKQCLNSPYPTGGADLFCDQVGALLSPLGIDLAPDGSLVRRRMAGTIVPVLCPATAQAAYAAKGDYQNTRKEQCRDEFLALGGDAQLSRLAQIIDEGILSALISIDLCPKTVTKLFASNGDKRAVDVARLECRSELMAQPAREQARLIHLKASTETVFVRSVCTDPALARKLDDSLTQSCLPKVIYDPGKSIQCQQLGRPGACLDANGKFRGDLLGVESHLITLGSGGAFSATKLETTEGENPGCFIHYSIVRNFSLLSDTEIFETTLEREFETCGPSDEAQERLISEHFGRFLFQRP